MTEDDFDAYLDYFDREEETSRPIKPRKAKRPVQLEELAETTGVENGFQITYKPSRHEAGWLLSSLGSFFTQELIRDVLAQVKGGKEACVYRCDACDITGETHLAAKVYRPRQFRNLRNDKMYREGRAILTSEGRAAKTTDHRLMRAVGKKTDFGAQVAHTSWLMHEYTTMERLYQAGAAVPRPIAAGENAILMTFCGDAQMAAPLLHDVRLDAEEAPALFAETLRNIELMLQHGLIHGDLSPFNILYWDGKITLIDFPQVASRDENSNAYFILKRDITRVCDYFAAQGVECDPAAITKRLWKRYAETEDKNVVLQGD